EALGSSVMAPGTTSSRFAYQWPIRRRAACCTGGGTSPSKVRRKSFSIETLAASIRCTRYSSSSSPSIRRWFFTCCSVTIGLFLLLLLLLLRGLLGFGLLRERHKPPRREAP